MCKFSTSTSMAHKEGDMPQFNVETQPGKQRAARKFAFPTPSPEPADNISNKVEQVWWQEVTAAPFCLLEQNTEVQQRAEALYKKNPKYSICPFSLQQHQHLISLLPRRSFSIPRCAEHASILSLGTRNPELWGLFSLFFSLF